MATNSASVTPETLITIKVSLDDAVKKLKLPLKDLNATALPAKLRSCLNIDADQTVIFERYSDSFGGFITLNAANTPVYKALVRAAKAKGKLRLKASIIPPVMDQEQGNTQVLANEVPQQVSDMGLPRPRRGNGIFQYREARASQQTLVNDEAPVPQPFTAHSIPAEAPQPTIQDLAFRTREPTLAASAPVTAWSVYCNICDVAMADAHYHCSICDGGDYDLCEKCVSAGKSCPGDDHWLIKRFIKDNRVVTSTTERVVRQAPAPMPGAFTEETKVLAQEAVVESTRTCNNCVVVLPEHQFVTCKDCEDFDLCIDCHTAQRHGHHPGHAFQRATADTVLTLSSELLLKAGRNVEHNAFCDGCDKKIFGIRHKCLQCPDWDYCDNCVKTSGVTHPRHRFAPLYEQLTDHHHSFTSHIGIYCDGPLCSKKVNPGYIQGVRYKCAVCHDTDFCASCEALPGHHHNRTHPLIKFTTPVRNVSITTINEDVCGNLRNAGDKPCVKTEPKNAAIPVQTVAEITPTEDKAARKSPQPLDGDVSSTRTPPVVPASQLNAIFVRDSIADGTVIAPGSRFTQIWTLRNEGPHAWPAGCSVRYVGGDNMLNVDNGHPASISMITEAIESSVVAREVQPGEEIAFRITLKAPMREGKSISYWRLKAADGTPFGHRLWCDIEVRRSPKAAQLSQQMPQFGAPPQPQFAPGSYGSHLNRVASLRQHRLQLLQQQQQQELIRQTMHPRGCDTGFPAPQMNLVRPSASEDEQLRKENAKTRMEAIRARILQTRAESLKTYAAKTEKMSSEEEPAKTVQEPVEQTAAPIERSASPVDEVKVESEVEAKAEEPSNSQMIFPKLEKESPASSIIASSKGKAAYVENEDGQVEQSAVPQSPSTIAEPLERMDDFDDLEVLSVSATSDDEDDDGFLTDEEYDILDASDRETVVSP